MKGLIKYFPVLVIFMSCDGDREYNDRIQIQGLFDKVEVIRDEAGMNHIYARNQHDLFMAQGYCAARDRLFQFEIWRRQATGTVAEILGPRELNRDIGTRLFMFRGDMKKEMQHYHPEGEAIIKAYVAGVNACIKEMLQYPDLLPVTFKALDIKPQEWTPEVVISRHQGLLGNIGTELSIGRAVAKLGPEKVKEYYWFHPRDPDIALDPSINGALLFDDILALYNSFRSPLRFLPEDIIPEYRINKDAGKATADFEKMTDIHEQLWSGSNNWVVDPSLTANGHAYMANDPHRSLSIPSLRYMVHLSAPGWNVIGGGEPEIPGVSIGHNDFGAWGLTVFRTDGEDLYVYDLNPENLNQYRYQDNWEDMSLINESIPVKNSENVTVELHYTRHGPVTYIDTLNHKAYAVRCAWMEAGGSPYLASLRMNQAENWDEFRDACNFSNIPGENMIWADREGNIGWQAVGIAPIRKNFSGLVPVPGDGRYEWDGYLPIVNKPSIYNPAKGFIATANQNVIPESYTHWDAMAYRWADPFRGDRINEVLDSGIKFSMEDMKKLQTDYFSIPARTLVPFLANLSFTDSLAREAQKYLSDWDFILDKESIPAGIYIAWERELLIKMFEYLPDPGAQEVISSVQLTTLIRWIMNPEVKFGGNAESQRDHYLAGTFKTAVDGLSGKFGENMADWQYGQEKYKHVQITHPLGGVVNEKLQMQLNTPALPRGGSQYTPGSTSGANNQSSGASFRIIVDVNDWDSSVGTNAPGQSGDPESHFYKNLFEPWAEDEYFPVYFSKSKIESVLVEKIILIPHDGN
jgi:penicillin amidase